MIDVKNSTTEKEIMKYIVRTAAFLVIMILLSGNLRVLAGYFFGLIIGFLMFIRMVSTAKKSLGMSKDRIKRYRIGQYLLRYMVYALTLWAAYTKEYFAFSGTVVGLLTVKLGLIVWALKRALSDFFLSKFKIKHD